MLLVNAIWVQIKTFALTMPILSPVLALLCLLHACVLHTMLVTALFHSLQMEQCRLRVIRLRLQARLNAANIGRAPTASRLICPVLDYLPTFFNLGTTPI